MQVVAIALFAGVVAESPVKAHGSCLLKQTYSNGNVEVLERDGYQHVKTSSCCGAFGSSLGFAKDADSCAALVAGAGATSFALGVGLHGGKCFRGQMRVSADQYAVW